jgi:hypothetical protein
MSTAVTSQPQAPPATANLQNSLIYIPLSRIAPSKTNPRKTFDGPAMDELVSSIRANGVLQPVLVRQLPNPAKGADGVYELVAGERRFRAAKAVLLPSIPAMVRELTDQQVLEMQIIENLQREDVTALEEAEGLCISTGADGRKTSRRLQNKSSCKRLQGRSGRASATFTTWSS